MKPSTPLKLVLCTAMFVLLLGALWPVPQDVYSALPSRSYSNGVPSQRFVPTRQSDSIVISEPRFGRPALVVRGEAFELKVNLSASGIDPATVYGWECIARCVENSQLTYRFNYAPMEIENGIWGGSISTPSSMLPALYDIEVYALDRSGKDIGYGVEPHALRVYPALPETIRVVHLTDLHIGDPRGAQEDIQETIGWKAANKAIEEINLINPDFVLLTGDIVFGQNYRREYPAVVEVLSSLKVPFFACIGNHDGYVGAEGDGYDFWQEYIGPRYYSFDFGPYHFVGLNTYDWNQSDRMSIGFAAAKWGGQIKEEQLKWLEADLVSTSKPTVMFGHHNPLWVNTPTEGENSTNPMSSVDQNFNGEGREELLDLIYNYHTIAYLAGHIHYDNVTISNGVKFITTTTASSSHPDNAYWGYRYLELRNGDVENYNYSPDGKSIPSYQLNYTTQTNVEHVSLSIESKLNMTFFQLPVDAIFHDTKGDVAQGRGAVGTSTGAISYTYTHGEFVYSRALVTLGAGKTDITMGLGSYYITEGQNGNRAYLAMALNGAYLNTTPEDIRTGCTLSGKTQGVGSVRYVLHTFTPIWLEGVLLYPTDGGGNTVIERVEIITDRPVTINYTTLKGGGVLLKGINLSAGEAQIVIHLSQSEESGGEGGAPGKGGGGGGGGTTTTGSSGMERLYCTSGLIIILAILLLAVAVYLHRWRRFRRYGYS